jgi:hypothetical protein
VEVVLVEAGVVAIMGELDLAGPDVPPVSSVRHVFTGAA